MSFKIGRLKLEGNAVLAPMAGVTHAAFRLQCKLHGAALVYSPLMDEDGVIQAFSRFNDFIADERPLGGQIVGATPEKMAEAAKIIEPYVDLIDINFGCPDKDVIAKKGGVYNLKCPENIGKIIRTIKDAVNVPVTAKIRIGWDEKSINYLEVAKIVEDAGADALSIHGRTKEQGYSGKADWNAIKQVKEKANIPIIGSGDVNSPEKVKEKLESGSCDAVMIGRAAMGNPFIFSQINNYLRNGSYEKVTPEEKLDGFIELMEIYKTHQRRFKLSEIRTHALWFTKGVFGASELRQRLLKAEKEEDLKEILDTYLKNRVRI